MKIKIRNIAALRDADVEIKGITIVAGENNTGKSTIGKSLFVLFNGLKHLSEEIVDAKRNMVTQIFLNISDLKNSGFIWKAARKLAERLVKEGTAPTKFNRVIQEWAEITTIKIPEADIEKIEKILLFSNDVLRKRVLTTYFESEFGERINNLHYKDQPGLIELKIGDEITRVQIESDNVVLLENERNLEFQPIYLDDIVSFALESPQIYNLAHLFPERAIQTVKAILEKPSVSVENILSSEIKRDQIKSILDKLNILCEGHLVNDAKGTRFVSDANDQIELPFRSISAGLKVFVMLQELILNGSIIDRSTVILDEPEIHLHPQWQVALAEMLVLLQKEFGLHLLITSHSPYFISAVDIFSKKYQVIDNNRYYFSEITDEGIQMRDVTNNIAVIYNSLAAPYQTIQDEAMELDK